jgi:hypothetical protein
LQFLTPSDLRKWLMIYVVLLLAISGLFLISAWIPDIFGGYTIYWFTLHFDPLRAQLAFLVVPISILAIFGLMFIIGIHSNNLWIGSVILVTSLVACCARVPGISMVTQHRSQVKMADKTYNAMWKYSTWGGDDYFVQPVVKMYQCDNYNFLCHAIYTYSKAVVEPEKLQSNPWKIDLIPDPAAHTVTLQINSEAVYVHPVK